MSDQEQCHLLIDYFNQCLDENERESFEQHLSNCQTCKEELEELHALTEDLPFSSEPIEPNKGMKDRVLSNVFEQPVEKPVTDDYPKVEAINPEKKKENNKPRRTTKWLQPLLAASLLLSLTANAYFYMNDGVAEPSTEREEPMNEVVMNVELAASEGYSGNAQVAMVKKNEGMNLVVQAHNLRNVSGTQAYQVWLIDSTGEKFRAGTFVPNSNGTGAVTYPVNIKGEHDWQSVAVTLEPTPHSEQPKGDIVLSPKL